MQKSSNYHIYFVVYFETLLNKGIQSDKLFNSSINWFEVNPLGLTKNNHRYHESLNNLTPADVDFGRSEQILKKSKGSKTTYSQVKKKDISESENLITRVVVNDTKGQSLIEDLNVDARKLNLNLKLLPSSIYFIRLEIADRWINRKIIKR